MKTSLDTLNARNGALNLLVNCVGIHEGDRVLLVEEEPEKTLYCPQLTTVLEEQALAMGAGLWRVTADHISDSAALPGKVTDIMERSDHTIFLNRIGDYSRFSTLPGECSKTICYVLDIPSLASPFATVSYDLMSRLLERLEGEMQRASEWRITCPLGTDIRGTFSWPSISSESEAEFTLSLFPVSTFKPVSCATSNGKVMLSRWLLPGAAPKVEPATVAFDGVVAAEVANGVITAVDGPPASVSAVVDHYSNVTKALNIRGDRVHSWHAGINPLTCIPGPVDDDIERWGAVSFASPRYLHFHTCGDTPPGAIAWSVFNPAVWIDGEVYWDRGQFVWLGRHCNRDLIARYPDADCLLGDSADIGI